MSAKRINSGVPSRFRAVQTDDARWVIVEQIPIGAAYSRSATAKSLRMLRDFHRDPVAATRKWTARWRALLGDFG